ncbi:hypothetical protein FN846DRAFT_775348 [Sphaerosporella brunnea]|uniref:non-specific serine/threonine protein kinase n=1 Tax=Sphaerosporella brunnea TaxID=1250544 RepID=A0A5J5F2U8_9PEZI|nr:hypothetical protein FN846DRAFT_775348 [Sphaerosporella brunnea]
MNSSFTPLPSTPSRVFSASFDDTPLRSNSSAVRLYPKLSSSSNPHASNSTRAEMDPLLRRELRGAVFYDLAAFVDRFFPPSDAIANVYDYAVQAGLYDATAARWSHWPTPPTERRVLSFFQDVVDNSLLHHLATITSADDRRSIYRYVPSNEAPLRNGDCMRKTDLLLTTQAPSDRVNFAELRANRYDWGAVRVVGELKRNPKESNDEDTLVQLANYVREVLGAQPCRRSVHAFTLCGQHLRAWLFDRSGAIGGRQVDINAEPLLFLRIICGYANMDATQVGFDQSILWDRGRPYIYADIQLPGTTSTRRLEIKTTPIFSRHAIVTRGSACWKARPYLDSPPTSEDSWTYAVKDQWRACQRESECGIISSMMTDDSDHIVGLPQYISYSDFQEDGKPVDIASTVRRDLIAPKRKRDDTDAAAGMPPPPKRRSVSTAASEMPPPPKPRMGAAAAPAWVASHNVSSSCKRRASDALPPSSSSHSKRLTFGERSSSVQATKAVHSPSLPEFNNRIFSRLVMTPIGKSLDEFSSYAELLAALRDAIKGHQHLYEKHHVLHRDVSVYNILISPPDHPSAGVLIDLYLAININRPNNSGASHRTGTPDFMAIGVLDGQPHRACHDLESFFYVLLWLATFFDADANRLPDVPGTLWNACKKVFAGGGTFEDVAMMKRAFTAADQFETKCLARLADDARDALGPLLADWRDLLFPVCDEMRLSDDMHAAVVRRLQALKEEKLKLED